MSDTMVVTPEAIPLPIAERELENSEGSQDVIELDSDNEELESTESKVTTASSSISHSHSPTSESRRLSRKQPPALTESLTALALFATPASPPKARPFSLAVSPKTLVLPLPPSFQRKLSSGPPDTIAEETPVLKVAIAKPPYRPLKSVMRKSFASTPSTPSTPSAPMTLPVRQASLAAMTAQSSTPQLTPSSSRSASSSAAAASGAPTLDSPSSEAPPLSAPSRSNQSSTASSWSLRTPSSNESPACTNSSCTWSAYDAYVWDKRARTAPHAKLSRKEKKAIKKLQAKAFDPDTKPNVRQMYDASVLPVIDENGIETPFGDVIRGKRTIVVFIRHWFCPLCAQYMNSILAEVSPAALEEANVELIVIGNGSSKMLDGYRNKAFKCPFKMYTDPSLELYKALGLTRQTGDAGKDEDKGDYLIQTAMESTVQTIKRATKMPLLHSPGHFLQLGGEFIFDGTLECTYAHRMTTTRDHAPIRDICKLAGVELEHIHYEPGSPPPEIHRDSLVEEGEATEWRAEREAHLERIKQMKAMRRQGMIMPEDEDDISEEGEEEYYSEEEEDEETAARRKAREELMRRRFSGLGLSVA